MTPECSDVAKEEDMDELWPFQDRTLEKNDTVFIELELEGGRNIGSKIY